MTERIKFFRYVPHSLRRSYAGLGWRFAAYLGPTHGAYAVMMEWCGAGEPREPKARRRRG